MRAFLAVPADRSWVDSARDLTGMLKDSLPRASWSRPDAWHITLRFLGEIDEGAAEAFAAAIGPHASACEAGELEASGALVLPPRGRPRVLGVGFRSTPTLTALSRLAEAAARRIGLPPERKTFRPHVTFARIRERWPPAAVERFRRETDAWPFPAWRVRSCVLFHSRLDSDGAVHTPIAQWEAGAATAGAGA